MMKQRVNAALRVLTASVLICALLASAAPRAFARWQGTRKDAIKGVVAVLSTNDAPDDIQSFGMGSGFGVGTAGEETDVFVTNRHVVFDDETDSVYKYVYIVLEDGAVTTIYNEMGRLSDVEIQEDQLIRCEVLYPEDDDPEFPDIAILRAERAVPNRIAIPLKSGFEMSAGDKIYTMGFPGSADTAMKLEMTNSGAKVKISASPESVTVADGVISRTVAPAEFNETTVFQHTAAMNHGNSGGPLVDEEGYAVGINTYGFNQADNGVAEYKASLYVDYAMQKLDDLGIRYDQYEKENAKTQWYWIGGAAAAAAVIVCGLVVLLSTKTKSKSKSKTKKDPEEYAFRLQGVSGPFAGRRFALEGLLRIGRDPARNDLIFPAEARTISGTHCQLELKGKELLLTDLNSRNGTFLNGARLEPGVPKPLKRGDAITLAGEDIRFAIDVSPRRKQ